MLIVLGLLNSFREKKRPLVNNAAVLVVCVWVGVGKGFVWKNGGLNAERKENK